MKVIKELKLKVEGKKKVIYFGVPDTAKEVKDMYDLRYGVYLRKKFIDENKNKTDVDEYDKHSLYCIAKIDKQIIGSVRLIKGTELPIKKIFSFREPLTIKDISNHNRGEISRLVINKYKEGVYLPRNLVMLFLIDCLVIIAKKEKLHMGFAFIKESLTKKLNKLDAPVKFIGKYTHSYPKNGVLYKYFYESKDKVVPAYFFTQEMGDYLEKILGNDRMFEKIGKNKYFLKGSLYNRFLRILKII